MFYFTSQKTDSTYLDLPRNSPVKSAKAMKWRNGDQPQGSSESRLGEQHDLQDQRQHQVMRSS